MFYLLYAALVLFPNPSYFLSRRNILQTGIVMSSLFDTKTIKNGPNDDDIGFIRSFNNNLYYSGPITDSAIFSISSNLITIQNEANFDHINLHMQSQGGSLLPSLGLVDLIRTSYIPINTFVDGYCASAASLITVVGAQRFINRYGVILIHQLKMGVEPSKYLEIRDQTDNADTLMKIVKDIYLENTRLSNEKLDELLMHDWWLNSTLTKKYGIVDIVI